MLHRRTRPGRGGEGHRHIARLCLHLYGSDAEARMTPSTPSTEAIWTRLSADLRRFIRRRVADDHVADDLLQETFLRVHRNVGTLREGDRVAAWVFQIARNAILDHHRRAANPAVALGDTDPADEPDDPGCSLRCRGAGWLDEMIRSLPDGYREAVRLAEVGGLSQQAVAERLGLSLSGAKSRVQRGRAMLKDALDRCCRFEFDARGNMMDYVPRPERTVCRDCDQ